MMVKEGMHKYRQLERLRKCEEYELTEEGVLSVGWAVDSPDARDAALMRPWRSE